MLHINIWTPLKHIIVLSLVHRHNSTTTIVFACLSLKFHLDPLSIHLHESQQTDGNKEWDRTCSDSSQPNSSACVWQWLWNISGPRNSDGICSDLHRLLPAGNAHTRQASRLMLTHLLAPAVGWWCASLCRSCIMCRSPTASSWQIWPSCPTLWKAETSRETMKQPCWAWLWIAAVKCIRSPTEVSPASSSPSSSNAC